MTEESFNAASGNAMMQGYKVTGEYITLKKFQCRKRQCYDARLSSKGRVGIEFRSSVWKTSVIFV